MSTSDDRSVEQRSGAPADVGSDAPARASVGRESHAQDEEPTYQTMGAGGMDVSTQGAAAADDAATGGRIGTWAGGARSTGGMPKGMGIGSDIGTIGSSAGRGTGAIGAGRSGDLAEGAMSDREAPIMGATTGSSSAAGGGAASSGGATAPVEPSPDRADADVDR